MPASPSKPPTAIGPAAPQPTMRSLLFRAFGMLAALTVLTGLVYPSLVTAMARAAFAEQANGSLIVEDGKTIGSRLVGQPFEDPGYFWGRLSSTTPTPYNGGSSAASNLGPTNHALTRAAQQRVDALRAADPGNAARIPVDLVTSSASGLDPHITPAAALYQVPRVARARGVEEARVRQLVLAQTEDRTLGIIGEARVNVLLLNLSLDASAPAPSRPAPTPSGRLRGDGERPSRP
jgi:K+-transporting ATPase ATPase C chain